MSFIKFSATASISILIFAISANAAPRTDSSLNFASGDTLSGDLSSCSEGKLTIQSPNFKTPTTVFTKNLLKLKLPDQTKSDPKKQKPAHEATIFIKGRHSQEQASDQIKGRLKQIKDDSITLKTDYAGEIIIDRKFVTNLEINATKSGLYAGPSSIDEWNLTDSDEAWFYRNNSFISGSKNGQIAKDVDLQKLSHMSFNLDWKSSLNFRMLLYSDDANTGRPSNYYELVLRTNYIYMRKYTKNEGSLPLEGSASIRQLTGVDTTFLEIFSNAEKGIFYLYLDGELSATLTDPTPTPDKFGPAIHFNNEVRSPTRIRDIRVSRWTGILPTRKDETDFDDLKGDGQRILLKNGDAILGKLGEIKDDVLMIETQYTPIRVPVAAMRTVKMKGSFRDKESPKMEAGDVKAFFHSGGWVIIKLDSITKDSITGYHQAFGTKTFKLTSFSHIEFNIYDRDMNASRTTSIW